MNTMHTMQDQMAAAMNQEINQDHLSAISGPKLPIIMWANGRPDELATKLAEASMKDRKGNLINPNMKLDDLATWRYTGGFFISDETEYAEEIGWNRGVYVPQNADAIQGFTAQEFSMSIITSRFGWEVSWKDGSRKTAKMFNQYDRASALSFAKDKGSELGVPINPTGRRQTIVIVKGVKSPLLLTLAGNTSKCWGDDRQVAGKDEDKTVMQSISELTMHIAKLRMEYQLTYNKTNPNISKNPLHHRDATYAMNVNVGVKVDDRGFGVFKQVGTEGKTSLISYPVALGLDDIQNISLEQYISELYVGVEAYSWHKEVATEYKEWSREWSSIPNGGLDTGSEGNANGNKSGDQKVSAVETAPAPVTVPNRWKSQFPA